MRWWCGLARGMPACSFRFLQHRILYKDLQIEDTTLFARFSTLIIYCLNSPNGPPPLPNQGSLVPADQSQHPCLSP